MDDLIADFVQWLWKFVAIAMVLTLIAHLFARRARAKQTREAEATRKDAT